MFYDMRNPDRVLRSVGVNYLFVAKQIESVKEFMRYVTLF